MNKVRDGDNNDVIRHGGSLLKSKIIDIVVILFGIPWCHFSVATPDQFLPGLPKTHPSGGGPTLGLVEMQHDATTWNSRDLKVFKGSPTCKTDPNCRSHN